MARFRECAQRVLSGAEGIRALAITAAIDPMLSFARALLEK
jgi:hypothetical protein